MKVIKNEREVLGEGENGKITVGEKLSLNHCKKILNRNACLPKSEGRRQGNNYSDAEIIEIREFLYVMATLDYLFFTEQYLKKQETINTNQNNYDKESIPLHPGEYRRAS